MPPPNTFRHSSNRPSIGMLTAWLKGPTEINLWHGVADRAQEQNINLVCFSGGIPHWPQEYEAQKNILFKIAGQQNVDGLLIWANILSHTLDPKSMEAFCRQYAPLPVISMGMLLPSIPSIRIDMREGIHKLLTHLIEVHGRRKIAFICGLDVSQDAQERYQAFCDTLVQYGLPVDLNLIVHGDFRRDSGKIAIQQLIENHPNDFNAIVSANDNMAIGAIQALQEHGIQIPDDVIVAGFDDIEETRAISPTLTTVRTPWHTLGSKSVDLMLAKLEGKALPEQILLQTELVCRQSCGCQAAGFDKYPAISNDHAGSGFEIDPQSRLMAAFAAEVHGGETSPGLFIQSFVEILSRVTSGTEIIEWQEALNTLRPKVRSLFQAPAEVIRAHELLESGYALVGEMAHRRQLSQRLEAVNQTDRLNRIVQTMSTTYDIETLMNLLALELPGLGIQSCFLSLYDEKGENPAWSRLILASDRRERLPLDSGGVRFPTNQLVPTGMFPTNRQIAFDVEALYFQDKQIGFVLFEIGPRDGDVYTTLRGHLSSTLKSAELVQVVLDAEAKAIKADQLKTRLLANVSHELRTPINIILGLSQIALSSPNSYEIDLPDRLIQDLKHIYDCGEHLVRLINDLLDVSRAEVGELDLWFEPVSPRSLLKETFDSFRKSSFGTFEEVELILDVPERLPILHADPVRLRQILMNLLSNALKFTRSGKIVLGAEVQMPHLHIWVSDTGSGIPIELQERIFEPFVTGELPGKRKEGIGLGLSITRRLVALHNGSITLDSQPDAGSTFHVYIPLPGLTYVSAKEANLEGATPLLLWLSSNKTPPAMILQLGQKSGLSARWLGSLEDIDLALQSGKPAALAWDLENVRPGDWSIVQKLRSYSQYSSLPLLLFQENIGEKITAGDTVTNIILKPAGKQTFQHILDLLPQSAQHGEIWIIDDDPQALKYYQSLLQDSFADFLVRVVCGGREALGLLSESTPDLVILDLVMPEVDGFQVLEHLRSNLKTASTPVIILTGKMLSYEDVKRLDSSKVFLETKGILTRPESVSEVQHALTAASALPQPTSLLVKQIFAHIQQNYTRTLTLKELAETVGVSKSYLSRIFKMDTGISLWDYLNRFRIQKARELLLLTDESITEIAANVGYEDVGYFGRIFNEISGCSPRAYRQHSHPATPG